MLLARADHLGETYVLVQKFSNVKQKSSPRNLGSEREFGFGFYFTQSLRNSAMMLYLRSASFS